MFIVFLLGAMFGGLISFTILALLQAASNS